MVFEFHFETVIFVNIYSQSWIPGLVSYLVHHFVGKIYQIWAALLAKFKRFVG